jgi:prepilin-type N-terminal cleavage/methylation domain-containing protein
MERRDERGFTMIEMLIGLLVLSLAAGALTSLALQGARVNKSQQMLSEVQSNARSCMELVVARLRSAGWDPMNAGIATVAWDPNPVGALSQIEVFADFDEDGLTDSVGEHVLIRHVADRVEWRLEDSAVFDVLASGISNDSDGDGTIEPMFQPDDAANPRTIRVRITASAPAPDLRSGEPISYMLENEITLRNQL